MGKGKGHTIRQKILDDCLKSERGYSTKEMMERCNCELEFRGEPKISALNTIRDDILEIENTYRIQVEKIRSGRNIRYRYEQKGFSIYSAPFTKYDIANLQEILSSLRAYQGRPQFEWLEETNARIQTILSCHQENSTPVVGFDDNPDLKGMEYFQPLFNAIRDKRPLILSYRNFKQNIDKRYSISPYYLKQYNNRWFLMAQIQGFENLSIYALDRITALENSSEVYLPNSKYNFQTYFNDIVGVSKPNHGKVERIRFWVSSTLKPYIITKPLHNTQSIVKETENGVDIEIKVIPNYELEQLLLSYGDGLKVVNPLSFKAKLAERIKKTVNFYYRFNSTEPIGCKFASENDSTSV